MTDLRFDDRTIIITGAGRGVGRAYALELARRGANVIVNNRSEEPARETAAAIEAAGGACAVCVADVSDPASGEAMTKAALEHFGGLDAVIANASINAKCRRFPELTLDDLDEMLGVNVRAAFYLLQAAWPHLEASGRGRVLLTTSQAALYGMPDRAEYAAAKGAVIGMTRALALEGEAAGIKVNAIAPSASTRMSKESLKDAEVIALLDELQPPELVAPAVTVFVHETCPVSGEIYVAGAGHIGRAFMAETQGLTLAPDAFTAEAVAERLNDIRDETGHKTPRDVSETGDPALKAHVMDRLHELGIIR